MKVLICGSRDIKDELIVFSAIHAAPFNYDLIIHGGAVGVDSLAERLAKNSNIPTKIYYPDWKTHGKKAGVLRNIEMVNAADAVIAIWDGKSRGTKSTIDYTNKVGKPLYIKQI